MTIEESINAFKDLVIPVSANPGSQIEECFSHIGAVLVTYLSEINKIILSGSDTNTILFVPMLARGLIEGACLALSGRLDATRLLVLRGIQMSPDYNVGDVHKASFRWQGDVLGEKVDNLWAEKSAISPQRALLGDYYDNLYWRNAFSLMIDETTTVRPGAWLSKIKRLDEKAFVSFIRSELTHLYSVFSKGIHCEFVVPCGETYDANTVRVSMSSALSAISLLAFVSNFIVENVRVSVRDACEKLERIEGLEALWLPE